ncbi:MAG: hypothetical protein Q9221_006509 [Calogaya cf. arnoldii]
MSDIIPMTPIKAFRTTEEIQKAIRELQQNSKTSTHLYELSKKTGNPEWITRECFKTCKPYDIAFDYYTGNDHPAVVRAYEAESLGLNRCPMEELIFMKHRERVRSLISGLQHTLAERGKRTEEKTKEIALEKPVEGPLRVLTLNNVRHETIGSNDTETRKHPTQSKITWRQAEQNAQKAAAQKLVEAPPRMKTLNGLLGELTGLDDTTLNSFRSAITTEHTRRHKHLTDSIFPRQPLSRPQTFRLPESTRMSEGNIQHPIPQNPNSAIVDLEERFKRTGVAQSVVQDNQDGWNVVDATEDGYGTVMVEENLVGHLDQETENENADWDLCE